LLRGVFPMKKQLLLGIRNWGRPIWIYF